MNIRIRKTTIALAVTALIASPLAFAADDTDVSADINHQHVVYEEWTNNVTNINTDVNTETNTATNSSTNSDINNTSNSTSNANSDTAFVSNENHSLNTDVDLTLDAAAKLRLDAAAKMRFSSNEVYENTERSWSNEEYENINRTEVVNSDVRKEGNEHQVSVSLKKDLSLTSDINFSGNPTISGDIVLDSAAIAIIDNRQSSSDNLGMNDMLTNDAAIEDDVGSEASGNLAFNVAAGDNNVQDNAAALSAADASFAFGMADAEIFVNQSGTGNLTVNSGVTNDASIGGNAFGAASGNIGVNVTSGNNNQQKNALAASVATSAYAQSSVSSNQHSSGNVTDNAGHYETRTETVSIDMTGTVAGDTIAVGMGGYEGTSQGSFEGSSSSAATGFADQIGDVYPDMWTNSSNDDQLNPHPGGNLMGHFDLDTQTQGGSDLNDDGGALAFTVDTESEGSTSGSTSSSDSGELGFLELGYAALDASLSGSVTNTYFIAVDATNTANLSGSAFSAASGNIGVNVAAGTGNLQANSLAMAVAQPSAGGNGGGNGGGGEQ